MRQGYGRSDLGSDTADPNPVRCTEAIKEARRRGKARARDLRKVIEEIRKAGGTWPGL